MLHLSVCPAVSQVSLKRASEGLGSDIPRGAPAAAPLSAGLCSLVLSQPGSPRNQDLMWEGSSPSTWSLLGPCLPLPGEVGRLSVTEQ